MTVVKHLASMDQRMEGPGVYLLADDRHTFGIKPLRSEGDYEYIPFTWATEFPPLGEFVLRFPGYWKADGVAEFWMGGPFNPSGIYWARYDPRSLGGPP